MSPNPIKLNITVDSTTQVSALLQAQPDSRACYVFAHGAGAGMTHPFMTACADGLGAGGIATLRYQFPYMERGSKRPDAPLIAHATVRAACVEAAARLPGVPLFAGGKSFGGRMTSQAQAGAPLADVRGLIFLGFPLHPPKQPSEVRASHLAKIGVPMLFLQGTRDELAQFDLITGVVQRLGAQATLIASDQADHSFHVLKRSGRDDKAVLTEILDALAAWVDKQLNVA